jgi:hypothetical protein
VTVYQTRHLKGQEKLIACYASGGFVRATIEPRFSFSEALDSVNRSLIEAQEHMVYPAEEVVGLMTELAIESFGSENQQTIMLFDNFETIADLHLNKFSGIDGGGRNNRIFAPAKLEMSPFTFRLSQSPSGVIGSFVYSQAYYSDALAESYMEKYIGLMGRFVGDCHLPLSLLSETEAEPA